jgi:hypothetical protein
MKPLDKTEQILLDDSINAMKKITSDGTTI